MLYITSEVSYHLTIVAEARIQTTVAQITRQSEVRRKRICSGSKGNSSDHNFAVRLRELAPCTLFSPPAPKSTSTLPSSPKVESRETIGQIAH